MEPVESQGTIADGLDVPAALMGHGILRAISESGGAAVAVGEDRIRAAFERPGRHGVNAGYEASATLAGFESLRERGSLPAGAKVLLLDTGSHLIPLGWRILALNDSASNTAQEVLLSTDVGGCTQWDAWKVRSRS